ncbi:AraC family transcriptional regulator [Agromyces bauzanensis]
MVVDTGVARRGIAPPAAALRRASMEEAMNVAGLVFHRHVLTALDRSAPPLVTLNSYRVGPITLGTLEYTAGIRMVTGTVRDAYQVNLVVDGALRTAREGDTLVATPRRAAAYGLHRHEFELSQPATTRLLGVKVERAALERRLEQLLGRSLHGSHIEFDLAFPLDTMRGRDWYAMVQILARRLWGGAGLATSPEVLSSLQDAVLTGLLLSSSHSFSDELAQPAGAATPRAVQRAIDYVDAHPEAALVSVPELADTVGVGIRALQAGFRQSLGTTPLTFLRNRRLTHARRDLEQLSTETSSVAEIAERWGFAHHGRFALEYRRRFDEHPSETLRR